MPDKIRAVFLDRDGVLNRAPVRQGRPFSPRTVAEFEVLPEAPAAVAALHRAGFFIAVATNQPDLGRGEMTSEELRRMHDILCAAMPIDAVFVCPHSDPDCCNCRKPAPGMLFDAAAHHNIDLTRSYMVGDRWRDIDAGLAAGVTALFIDRGYEEKRPTGQSATLIDVSEAAAWILADRNAK